jgi:dUTPase
MTTLKFKRIGSHTPTEEAEELSDTESGEGGFGSSGVK